MELRTVTVTGADESVEPSSLRTIAREFPFVEFGILMSRSSEPPRPRFPGLNWIRDATSALEPRHLSAHLCGTPVDDSIRWPGPGVLHGVFLSKRFGRVQLNLHGIAVRPGAAAIRNIIENSQAGVIAQMDGVNDSWVTEYAIGGAWSPLFDLSHGAGVLPESWPDPPAGYVGEIGYAGGLSPINVAEHVQNLLALEQGRRQIWIDAETHLRSDNDQRFNLVKVVDFLKAARPFVAGHRQQ